MNKWQALAHQQLVLSGGSKQFYSIPALQKAGVLSPGMPYSVQVLLESALRCSDEMAVEALLNWQPKRAEARETFFMPARIVLQDYTGVPLLVDLAALRSAALQRGMDPGLVEPSIPVDLVIDHALQTNVTNTPKAAVLNQQREYQRNRERYAFMKWGGQAFQSVNVIPPGVGIVHQINMEYLAQGLQVKGDFCYPDSVVGTDSHTTMINGMGIVGWGVGGIEAEAAMLGQPMCLAVPDVVGVHLQGQMPAGVSITDMLLQLTQRLRQVDLVGKVVEYFGEGVRALSVQDRCTIANMAPEYGATMGVFAVDDKTLDYYRQTGRSPRLVDDIQRYYQAQGWLNIQGEKLDYSEVVAFDLAAVCPCVAGPSLPNQRVVLADLKASAQKWWQNPLPKAMLANGDIVLAAITSCTNTANPELMVTAGLVAKRAVQAGLTVAPSIKTSLTSGSQLVTTYLKRAGLSQYLDALGFYHSGYGCATCAGNVGGLNEHVEAELAVSDVTACAVLSGNRNFEARIHPLIKANFLMSPALVVVFAIVGHMRIDLAQEPIGHDSNGQAIYLSDLWPSSDEVAQALRHSEDPEMYRQTYQKAITQPSAAWQAIPVPEGQVFSWDLASTYIAEPPYFTNMNQEASHATSA